MDVVSAANAGLEHAAAPDRELTREHQVVDLLGGLVSTNSANLDVDDLARVERDRFPRVVWGVDALVETDRGSDGGLELGMVDDVVPAERLLVHHQVQLVERLKCRNVT